MIKTLYILYWQGGININPKSNRCASISNLNTKDQGRRLKWCKVVLEDFYDDLVNTVGTEIDLCLDDKVRDNEILTAYAKICNQVARALTYPHKEFLNRGERWFDHNCTVAHQKLLVTLKHQPQDKILIAALRKTYKLAIHILKSEIKHEAWNDLLSIDVIKNSAKFWEIVNKSFFHDSKGNSPEEEWFSHLKYIYGDQKDPGPPGTPFVAEAYTLVFTDKEVAVAFVQLSSNKAPGLDSVPADLLKSNVTVWSKLLAHVFNMACKFGLPKSWSQSIIVPVFKKGKRGDPRCYRPISLIDSAVKVLGRVVLSKLTDWLTETNILSNLQYAFRKGRGTTDQCLNLHQLAGKYTKKGTLYLAFMDLSSAFDQVNRSKLWALLIKLGVDKIIANFLADLHRDLTATVRFDQMGSRTQGIRIIKRVRQGCILAPLLFTLYINNLDLVLGGASKDIPCVGERLIPALLYADDAALLARTAVGLQRLLTTFVDFMRSLDLNVNFSKSHTMIIGSKPRRPKMHHCEGNEIARVTTFTYLVVLFDDRSTWVPQKKAKRNVMARSTLAVLDFARRLGAKPIQVLLNIYRAKCIAISNYGSEIWGYREVKDIQIVENKFLRNLLSLPQSTPSYIVHQEAGVGFVSDLIGVAPLLKWIAIWINPELEMNSEIMRNCLALDRASSIPWLSYVKRLAMQLGRPELFNSPDKLMKEDILWAKKTYLHVAHMEKEARELKKPMVRAYQLLKTSCAIKPYLNVVTNPNHCFLLVRFRFNQLHFLLAEPQGWRRVEDLGTCTCDNFSTQDTLHFVLFCEHFLHSCQRFILPILRGKGFLQAKPALIYLQMLTNVWEIFNIVSFLTAAVRTRKEREGHP